MNWKILFIYCLFLFSCETPTMNDSNDLEKDTLVEKEIIIVPEIDLCDVQFDTITKENYSMHVAIFKKFNNPDSRAYTFNEYGDTTKSFLYHQDVAAFVQRLNPSEDRAYSIITNKVIFLIIENDPYALDYGLTQWPAPDKQLNYFFHHVEHPICNENAIDSIIVSVERNFGEPHNRAIEMKRRLLSHLELAKENTQ